ncbi:hypothetical protein ACTGWG_03010 [Streptococcus suis]
MDSHLVSLAESIAKELPAIHLPRNKQAPLGFSWTTFFFTMWVAVFRQDWKWAGIMFAANALIGTLASQFDLGDLVFAVNIVMGFLYNKLHLKELQKKVGNRRLTQMQSSFVPKVKSNRQKMTSQEVVFLV